MTEDIKKNLDTMLQKPVTIKLLDGKEYKIPVLNFNDAFKLGDKISMINLVPAVAIADKKQRETLLEILEVIFSYYHPEITKEKIRTEKLLNLFQVRQIINIALDLSGLKKESPLPE